MKNASVTFRLLCRIYAILLNNLSRGSIVVWFARFFKGEDTHDIIMLSTLPSYNQHLDCHV